MIGNLNTSEKRLLAALDRIDTSIARAAQELREGAAGAAPRGDGDAKAGDALAAENLRLGEELAAAQARIAALENEHRAAVAQIAELGSANEALAQANNQLLLRADGGGAGADDTGRDEIRAALEAENAALRQAREAEIGRIGAIVAALDALLGEGAADSLLPPDTLGGGNEGNGEHDMDEGR